MLHRRHAAGAAATTVGRHSRNQGAKPILAGRCNSCTVWLRPPNATAAAGGDAAIASAGDATGWWVAMAAADAAAASGTSSVWCSAAVRHIASCPDRRTCKSGTPCHCTWLGCHATRIASLHSATACCQPLHADRAMSAVRHCIRSDIWVGLWQLHQVVCSEELLRQCPALTRPWAAKAQLAASSRSVRSVASRT